MELETFIKFIKTREDFDSKEWYSYYLSWKWKRANKLTIEQLTVPSNLRREYNYHKSNSEEL